jgi:hypothetical protein
MSVIVSSCSLLTTSKSIFAERSDNFSVFVSITPAMSFVDAIAQFANKIEMVIRHTATNIFRIIVFIVCAFVAGSVATDQLRHAEPKDVIRAAELDRSPRVACSDL